jgi:transcription elongation factor Elf1
MSSGKKFKEASYNFKKMQRELELMKSRCNHQKDSGKYKIQSAQGGKPGDVVCEICGTRFNMNLKPRTETNYFLNFYNDIINQLKLYAEPGDEEAIAKISETQIHFKDIIDAYTRTAENVGSNKKKEKRDENNTYASIGMDKMQFNKR